MSEFAFDIRFCGLLLIIGGGAMGMIGMFWDKGGRLLEFFEVDIDRSKGEKLFWIGAAMLACGFATFYIVK